MVVYSHPDGGTYVIADQYPVQMKMDDQRWETAVYFRRVVRGPSGAWQYEGKNHFCVTQAHWAERFVRIESDG